MGSRRPGLAGRACTATQGRDAASCATTIPQHNAVVVRPAVIAIGASLVAAVIGSLVWSWIVPDWGATGRRWLFWDLDLDVAPWSWLFWFREMGLATWWGGSLNLGGSAACLASAAVVARLGGIRRSRALVRVVVAASVTWILVGVLLGYGLRVEDWLLGPGDPTGA
jgi:hypothetical protein